MYKRQASDLVNLIKKGNGKAVLKTVSCGTLTAWMKGKDIYLTDENGNSSKAVSYTHLDVYKRQK